MRLNFRQGIVRRQQDIASQPAHLVIGSPDPSYVDLVVAPTPTVISFAFRDEDYLYQEDFSVDEAWGSFPATGETQYLLWDLDLVTGRVTRTYTIYPIVVDSVAPTFNREDQHWFDTTENVMKVQKADLSWTPKARVVAGIYDNTGSIQHVAIGSQVGITGVNIRSGYIIFDEDGYPIKQRDGAFVTSESTLLSETQSTSAQGFRINEEFTKRVKSNTILSEYSIVTLVDSNLVELADSSDTTRVVSGIILEDLLPGTSTRLVTAGRVYDENFTFDSADIGKNIYTTTAGAITLTAPTSGIFQVVGTVYDENSIFINIQPPIILA